jgi:dihydrofolate reductase
MKTHNYTIRYPSACALSIRTRPDGSYSCFYNTHPSTSFVANSPPQCRFVPRLVYTFIYKFDSINLHRMKKLVLFMHTSLDGYTAGANGEMNWIGVSDELFEEAGRQTQLSDIALYGRGTFEIMQAYWPTAADEPDASKHDIEHGHWYNKVDKYVASASMEGKSFSNTTIISHNIIEQIAALKQKEGDKQIVMFGSPSLGASLMERDLIDEYWLFVNPIILGQGKLLFKPQPNAIKLQLAENKTFSNGVICLHYVKL